MQRISTNNTHVRVRHIPKSNAIVPPWCSASYPVTLDFNLNPAGLLIYKHQAWMNCSQNLVVPFTPNGGTYLNHI